MSKMMRMKYSSEEQFPPASSTAVEAVVHFLFKHDTRGEFYELREELLDKLFLDQYASEGSGKDEPFFVRFVYERAVNTLSKRYPATFPRHLKAAVGRRAA